MHKKKSKDKAKAIKLSPEVGVDLLQSLIDEATPGRPSYMHGEGQIFGQLATAALNAAIDLSKLVIENRILNSEKMNDEDIYEIYSKSFKSIMKTTVEDPMS